METLQEKKVMIAALKREIASSESALLSLKQQLTASEGKHGMETRELRLKQSILQLEKNLQAAAEQLALRTGGVVRRGPGRPPKPQSK